MNCLIIWRVLWISFSIISCGFICGFDWTFFGQCMGNHLDETLAFWVLLILILVGIITIFLLVLMCTFSFKTTRVTYITNASFFFLFGSFYIVLGVFFVVLNGMLIKFVGIFWNPKAFEGAYQLFEKKFSCCGYGLTSNSNETRCQPDVLNCQAFVIKWFAKFKFIGLPFLFIGVADFACTGSLIYFAIKYVSPQVGAETNETIEQKPISDICSKTHSTDQQDSQAEYVPPEIPKDSQIHAIDNQESDYYSSYSYEYSQSAPEEYSNQEYSYTYSYSYNRA